MFADVHSHVLCGIDDGAKDVAQSRALLSQLHQNGVTHLALTPHYYPYQYPLASFLKRRKAAFDTLLTLPEAKGFAFSLAAEVYLSDTLLNHRDLSRLCYEGSTLMLTELEFADSLTESTRFRLLRLTQDYGLRPVLAHIDRYPFLWRDERCLEQLREMGCLFQVNFSALASVWKRRRALHLLDRGYLNFVGEDVHRFVVPKDKRDKIWRAMEKAMPGVRGTLAESARRLIFDAG